MPTQALSKFLFCTFSSLYSLSAFNSGRPTVRAIQSMLVKSQAFVCASGMIPWSEAGVCHCYSIFLGDRGRSKLITVWGTANIFQYAHRSYSPDVEQIV